jgi:hypothetical protein
VRWTSYREDLWREAIEKGLGERAELYQKVRLSLSVVPAVE